MHKVRLDLLLVENWLVESRSLAQRLVMAGRVRVDGEVVLKPATTINPNARLEIDRGPRYVSRGGEKLESALLSFRIEVNGMICADIGSSTGGFTDCLLQNGAARVYAIDVGKGILHWRIRQDKRVVVMEGTNARYIDRLPEPIDLVTVDASFISLKTILPVVKSWFPPRSESTLENEQIESKGSIIALIKPQFEAGKVQASRGKGVIRNPVIHRQVLLEVLNFAQQQGFIARGLICSPLKGPKGNVEFLAWLTIPSKNNISLEHANLEELIQANSISA